MKKVIALLLALVMVFALCACGSSSSAPASSDSSAKKEALTFTTGGEAGTYYAFGSVLAQYVSNNSNLSVTAITAPRQTLKTSTPAMYSSASASPTL